MIRLLLDVGNTSTTYALIEVRDNPNVLSPFLERGHVDTHPLSSLGTRIKGQLKAKPFEGWVASVVRGAPDTLERAFKPIPIHRVLVSEVQGFKNETLRPEQVGIDRLVNVRSALAVLSPPFIILDTGTATTLCAVDKHGNYKGGAILPGLGMMRDALHVGTSLLPSIELAPVEHAIGQNTEQALLSGIVLASADALRGLYQRFRLELGIAPGAPIRFIATGGKVGLLSPYLPELTDIDPDLTLKGIALCAEDKANGKKTG